MDEIIVEFGAASFEPTSVQGFWRHEGIVFTDSLSKIVIDVDDTAENRQWMREFKSRWMSKLEQIDLWLVSYVIDVD